MDERKWLINKMKKHLSMLLIFITILGLSIGYSALNTDLSISGEAVIRVDDDIRIIDVKLVDQINGAYEIYNSNYSKYTSTMSVDLPNINSSITYEVTIMNDSPYKYELVNVDRESSTNSNIVYTVTNLIGNEVIEEKETTTFVIQIAAT